MTTVLPIGLLQTVHVHVSSHMFQAIPAFQFRQFIFHARLFWLPVFCYPNYSNRSRVLNITDCNDFFERFCKKVKFSRVVTFTVA